MILGGYNWKIRGLRVGFVKFTQKREKFFRIYLDSRI